MLAAKGAGSPDASRALSELCETYWRPLYAFTRSRGARAEDAEEQTQAFFLHLLQGERLASVDPAKGRFRSFLLVCFKNFLADERIKQQALKRGAGRKPISLDAQEAEDRYVPEPADEQTPEDVFERKWALTVIEQALLRLEQRYAGRGKQAHFEALKPFLTGDSRPVPHAEIARQLGLSEVAVRVAVHRFRKRFQDALREEIAHTVHDPRDIDDEIRHLYSALGG